MSQALYRKWRPFSWEEVFGQDHITQTLHNAVITDRVAHAYLFAGPRGTGKTSCARLLAKAVNCLEPDQSSRPCNQCANCLAVNENRFMDLIEIDAASNTSVDDVRDLRDKINFSPSQGKFKVYIIDEVHMLSTSAFNALLKTLEEPPSHVIFILATTEIHKIPATVISRCQRYEFRRIPTHLIVEKLRLLCKEEEIEIADDTLAMIARQSTGSMRDAISLIDQLSSMTKNISFDTAQEMMGTATNQAVIQLIDALVAQDSAEGLTIIQKALDTGSDPRQFARQIVEYLRNLLLFTMKLENAVDAADDIKISMNEHASKLTAADIVRAINLFSNAATEQKANWHPGLGLELAYTQMAFPDQTSNLNTVSADQPVKTISTPTASKMSANKPVKTAKPQADNLEEEQAPQPVKVSKKHPPEIKADPVAPSAGADLAYLQAKWRDVKDILKRINVKTEALVNSANLVGIDQNTIVLSFNSDLVKDMMLKEKHIENLIDAVKHTIGITMKVKCTYGKQTPNKLREKVEFDADGMVGTAMRDLGGEITEITEK